MIKSVFSNYKEMVMLEPKYKHSSTDLFELTNKALDIIKNAGGTVITIITDSNRENINILKKIDEHSEAIGSDNQIFIIQILSKNSKD